MLKPRWLGLLVVLVAVLVSFTMLGLWQLSVARDDAQSQAAYAAPRQPVVALTTLLQPHSEFPGDASSRRVSTTGRYDATGQVVVPQRRLDGVSGSWVVTPFVVDATGSRIAVVRGFVADARGGPAAAPPPTTTGDITLVGSVAPGESPSDLSASLPAGQLGSVDLGRLVNVWPGDLYNAFLFSISETPDATGASSAAVIQRVPPPPVPTGFTLRNGAYAVQWWVFALFALYMYVRMVRDDARQDAALAAGPPKGEPEGPRTDATPSTPDPTPAGADRP
ncbi:SURF1 family protein [Lapillicoccus jejuensis]|uniref:SURF1-like protein n=2 Tax=Lapillicoccus jejuensis TaxID=402171 RepID=A0A542E246_9MICO|nr:cytochrome oxidase assembly protein ShyY1 [Lapillicoccus jejuensis]